MRWKVVPLSRGQLLDVRAVDVLNEGHFRKCDVYRGGGGYDRFPAICEAFFGRRYHRQFVVQLFGCNLDCPYCYVTREGVWGRFVKYTSEELVEAFLESGQDIFHLMGGAPALYLPHWAEIYSLMKIRCPDKIFHSDFMLTERDYDYDDLPTASVNGLFAISVKGATPEEFYRNTRKRLDVDRFWGNLAKLVHCGNNYITFTNVSKENIESFWDTFRSFFGKETTERYFRHAFSIDIINYEAVRHTDDVPWGREWRVQNGREILPRLGN